MSWVAGVDGFRSQWCVVLWHLGTGELRARIVPAFSGLLELPEHPSTVGVDIPIGLPEVSPPGGRACDREARRVLGRRASCVFSVVGRSALTGSSRAESDRLSRSAGGIGVGAQAWGLSAKLREADAAMTPERQQLIHEVHPELSFRALNEGVPMARGKKTAAGAQERVEALVRGGFPREFVQRLPAGLRVGRDDFLDACAAAWTARRVAAGRARRLPAAVERDARGLDMAIWC
ncbi:MAG TPA: DUF429 domain-containing protein [Microvirga sp.]|nr:DUF429 domain-containing protein [Microvirga sp.]